MIDLGSVLGTAASGMAAATQRLDVSARKIAQASSAADPPSPAPRHAPSPNPSAGHATDFAAALVDQMLALHAFRANLKVFEAGNDTAKALLDIRR